MAGKVKLRTVSDCSIVVTLLLALLCAVISVVGFQKYTILRNATQEYISCEAAVKQLQTGSDTLTKEVRFAALTGEQKYIDHYFEEANVTRSREKALADLSQLESDSSALLSLRSALESSVELMHTEYYAMRLVEETLGSDPSTWPMELQMVQLTAGDAALPSSEKLIRAQQMVLGVKYENSKERISEKINNSLNTLVREIEEKENCAAIIFFKVYRNLVFCVLLFAVMMLLIGLIMRFWIVSPLLDYNNSIHQGKLLTVHGANELQRLAKTYNEIYQENAERATLMKHQAEHDPLTELLNRGSFDRILNLYEKDKSRFALILVDVDTFKSVNDTYGHATGDAILKKVAFLLKTTFRTIDYVCRIGGDEFAIVMVDMTSDLSYTIQDKITDINQQLQHPMDNLPAVSLSVGAAFTDRPNPGPSLFKDADHALYQTKEHGKCGCTIYDGSTS